MPGPEGEVSVVREIFDLFTSGEMNESQISQTLNSRGLLTDQSNKWTRGVVHQLITSPKYMGANVFNRKSFKLKQKRIVNPPDMWIRKEGAFEAIVSPEQFLRAQEIIQSRYKHFTDDEMLEQLRGLFKRYDTLSGILIDETEGMPSTSAYRSRFTSLINAYTLIGFTPERDYSYIEANRALRQLHSSQCENVIGQLREAGAQCDGTRLRISTSSMMSFRFPWSSPGRNPRRGEA